MRHAVLVAFLAVGSIPKHRSQLVPLATRRVARAFLSYLDRRRSLLDAQLLA